jgi:hypothetical protein
MSTLIAEYVDKAITLVASALFLKFYFSSNMPRFYKKKWVVLTSCFLVIYSVIGVTKAYMKYADQRLPSKEEIQERIVANNTLVEKDFPFKSPDSFSFIIPAGYAYTVFPSGAISMTAVKKQAQSAIVVAVHKGNDELKTTLNETLKLLKNKNNTYKFSRAFEIKIGPYEAVRVDLKVEKQGMPIQGCFIFAKTGNRLYQFMMSCPATSFPEESMVYERVIKSIKLM